MSAPTPSEAPKLPEWRHWCWSCRGVDTEKCAVRLAVAAASTTPSGEPCANCIKNGAPPSGPCPLCYSTRSTPSEAGVKRFVVVAERSCGIRGANGRPVNPFHIRNIFDPNLRHTVERRTWESIDAKDEKAVRKLFDQACEQEADMRGFRIVSIAEKTSGLTECDMHEDESS